MNRTKVLLLVAGALAVAATVAWQRSFDAAASVPPPAQLRPVRATQDPTPVPASTVAAPAVPAKVAAADNAGAPATKPAPKVVSRAVRRDPPAPVAVAHAEPVSTPVAAAAANEPPAKEVPVAAKSGSAETFEAMAALSVRQRNFAQARDEFESALSHGGKATFALIHDHTSGNFDKKDPKATCVGQLTILANEVRFVAPEDSHGFTAGWADVRDSGGNRFFGSGIGGFHVTITSDGKYRNFNLAPESRDKAEGKLILELLSAHARRTVQTR